MNKNKWYNNVVFTDFNSEKTHRSIIKMCVYIWIEDKENFWKTLKTAASNAKIATI